MEDPMNKLTFPLSLLLAPALALGAPVPLKAVNVKFMTRGYCMAGSRFDDKALGGFGQSDNVPQRLSHEDFGRKGELSLVALPEDAVPFGRYRGLRVVLVNRTGKEIPFPASDSRLSIIQEARDAGGEWKPVEYLPSSWCGNSHHNVFLPEGHYWEFAAPAYTGAIKTKLRFVLLGDTPLYSQEFDGSVNPEQFTQKQGHTPADIMDPYNE
jgi:hypothetical protein